jgi:uncharacterized protein
MTAFFGTAKQKRRTVMTYKPSKFNYIHTRGNGELRMYNSMGGTKSLSIIQPEQAEAIKRLLKNGAGTEAGKYESFLINHGFLVPAERDEDSLRTLRMMEQTTDSTLDLIILPTEQCNFRCKYCYETFEKGKMDISFQEALVKYVRKNIHKFTGLHVSWFGGEPLEALDVISYLSEEFMKICKTAKKPYSAAMTTNGYNLTLDTYNKLTEYHVNSYQVTLDGLEKEHDSQRVLADGGGTFKTITGNLLDIKNNTRPFNTSFILRTNFTKRIIANLRDYIQFFSDNFGNDPRFSVYVHMASDWGGERVNEIRDVMLEENGYGEILKAIQGQNIQLNYGIHYSFLEGENRACYASRKNSVVIGSDGTLYKCTGDFTFEKNKVGALTFSGELRFNENYNLWLSAIHAGDKKCGQCFFGACCLYMACPANRIRGLDGGMCSFEKENMGLFLELFSSDRFAVI